MVRFRLPASIAVAATLMVLGGHGEAARRKPVRRHGAAQPRNKHVLLERHVTAVRAGQPNVQALAALVLDENGRPVYARNPDKERPIASISKLAATLAVVAGPPVL